MDVLYTSGRYRVSKHGSQLFLSYIFVLPRYNWDMKMDVNPSHLSFSLSSRLFSAEVRGYISGVGDLKGKKKHT